MTFRNGLESPAIFSTTRLKKLVDGGVLERRPLHSDAKRHEYVLTEKGEDLFATVVALRQWGDRWLFPKTGHPADMLDGRDQSPIARIEVRSERGENSPWPIWFWKRAEPKNCQRVRYHGRRKSDSGLEAPSPSCYCCAASAVRFLPTFATDDRPSRSVLGIRIDAVTGSHS